MLSGEKGKPGGRPAGVDRTRNPEPARDSPSVGRGGIGGAPKPGGKPAYRALPIWETRYLYLSSGHLSLLATSLHFVLLAALF